MIFIISLMHCSSYVSAQFGWSSPIYTGTDSDLIKRDWSSETSFAFTKTFKIKKDDKVKYKIRIRPGFNIDWYNFEENLLVRRSNNFTDFIIDNQPLHTYKSFFIFRTTSLMKRNSLQLPVNFYFKAKKTKYVVFAPGFYVEYLIGGKFKRKFRDDGKRTVIESKYKYEDDFYGFQRFQIGLSGHLDFKFLTLYGAYALTPTFKKDQGIEVRRYIVGVYINLFYFLSNPDKY